jgi:hypothetical protein
MSIHHKDGIRLPEPSAGDRATQVGSSHHFTGQIVLGDGPGRVVGLESHLEMKAALILAARSSTDALFEQIAFEWRDAEAASRIHYIDLVVRRSDGRWIGYAVRPRGRVTPAYLAELARIKAQAIGAGFLSDLRLFSEDDVDPVALFNAKLLHAVRVPDPDPDAAVRTVAARITGVTTVGALVDETALAAPAFGRSSGSSGPATSCRSDTCGSTVTRRSARRVLCPRSRTLLTRALMRARPHRRIRRSRRADIPGKRRAAAFFPSPQPPRGEGRTHPSMKEKHDGTVFQNR